jgi:hypothetical protein
MHYTDISFVLPTPNICRKAAVAVHDDSDPEDTNTDVADTVGKALALVMQVCLQLY